MAIAQPLAFNGAFTQANPGQVPPAASRNISMQANTPPAVSLPAPVAGWVTNLQLMNMPPNTALILDNMFPRAATVDVINGYSPWLTSGTVVLGGAVESLFNWTGPSSKKMVAAAAGHLWNVTNQSGAVSLKAGYANNRWQTSQLGVSGAQWTLGVNGSDTPFKFDGTTATDNTLSGTFGAHTLNSTTLINSNVFKQRAFFIENNTLGFWFLPVNAISGVMSYYDLSQFSKLGGYVVAMGNWTREVLNGMDIFAVFMTSEGEIIVYQGSDPADADNWSLVGSFFVGPPIGRRCLTQYGNDLMIIGVDGFQLVSQAVVRERINLTAEGQSLAFNFDNIQPTVLQAAQAYKANFGWQVTHYPRQRMAIFNIPLLENQNIEQYVVNTNTGAWCRWTNQNAGCWNVFNENLYFGDDAGNVMFADNGQDFNGSGIPWEMKTAFSGFGNPGINKQFQTVQPVLISNGSLTFNYGVDVDFGNTAPGFGTAITSATTPWGSPWGSAWSTPTTTFQPWLSAGVTGRYAAFHITGNTKNYTLSIAAINWTWMAGGVL